MTEKQIDRITAVLLRLAAVLLMLLAVLGIILLCTRCSGCDGCSGSDNPADTSAESAHESGTEPSHESGVVLPETPDAGQAYQDKLMFLGDSLTAHLVRSGKLTDGKNTKQVLRTENNMLNLNADVTNQKVAIPGTGTYVKIADACAQLKPQLLIITLGTDWGVSYLSEGDFKTCYSKLIQAIREASPTTTIILQSIFPVTAECKNLSNSKIDTCNGWVKDIAAQNGCRYLDTQSVLKDSRGNLKSSLCGSTDGIHLTDDAYSVILQYIRTHAVG